MFKRNLTLALAAVVLALTTFTSCRNSKATNTSTSGIARVYCDESFHHILDQEIEVFEYTYPEASIMPFYMTEAAALDSLLNRHCDLIITTRDLTDDQRKLLKAQGRAFRSKRIAVDAIAVIVNKNNDIDELSMNDLRDIITGKACRWGEVFPTHLKNDSIKILLDGAGTGVMHYLKEKFLDGKDFGRRNVYAQGSTEAVFDAVQKTKNAIGFVGVSWLSTDLKTNVKTLEQRVAELNQQSAPSSIEFTDRIKVMSIRGDEQIQGVKPYQYYINNGDYQLIRSIWAIDASAGGTLDHGFFSFLTGVIGQKIILQTGIMPAAEPVRAVEVTKN